MTCAPKYRSFRMCGDRGKGQDEAHSQLDNWVSTTEMTKGISVHSYMNSI